MPKPVPGSKTVSVIMPVEIYEALKSWAGSKDWSISQAAKNLIISGLDQELGSDPIPKKK